MCCVASSHELTHSFLEGGRRSFPKTQEASGSYESQGPSPGLHKTSKQCLGRETSPRGPDMLLVYDLWGRFRTAVFTSCQSCRGGFSVAFESSMFL